MAGDTTELREKIRALYKSAHFRELWEKVGEASTAALESNQASARVRIENSCYPSQIPLLAESLGTKPEKIEELARRFFDSAMRLHSPHYMGHQVPPPLPASSVFAAMVGLLNQGGALFEMSPFSTSVERAVLRRLKHLVGWSAEQGDGIVTNGGSVANLTAILAARNHRLKDAWQQGVADSKAVVMTGADAHYSISRAAGILGLGASRVVKIQLDSKRRMDVNDLKQQIDRCEQEDKPVICVIASAGSTPVGAFDPLEEISAAVSPKQIWLHVDGAHGASALFSDQHRSLLRGIQNADSITWDAHKMMFVPSLCTFLLYRDARTSYETFQQDAPYLFDGKDSDPALLNAGLQTLECTRQSMAIPVWGIWSLYGTSIFEDLVNLTFATTRECCEALLNTDDFLPMHDPQSNILCFQYRPAGLADEAISELQREIRSQLVASGNFYTTLTKLDSQYVLRIVIMNPLIEKRHFEDLLGEIRLVGQKVSKN